MQLLFFYLTFSIIQLLAAAILMAPEFADKGEGNRTEHFYS
jgi:hypothetical protein